MLHSIYMDSTSKQQELYDAMRFGICKEYQIGQTAFDIIMFLYNQPHYNTARMIREIRGIKSGIVSVEVEKLVSSGYVVRKADPQDRRCHRLFLTDKVTSITKAGKKMQEHYVSLILAPLKKEEIEMYNQLCDKITAHIRSLKKEDLIYD